MTSRKSDAVAVSVSSVEAVDEAQVVYARLPFPPLGLNDSYGNMRQRGFKKPKNYKTSQWQDSVAFHLGLAGLKPFPSGKQEGKRVFVYGYSITRSRDVDHCEKFLLDAVAWALCPKFDSIGRKVYQDSWQGSAYFDKEWAPAGGKETLEVWVVVQSTATKDLFNEVSRVQRRIITDRIEVGDPGRDKLPPLGGKRRG